MDNPFLNAEFEIRWSRLKPEYIESAIDGAISRVEATVEAIATQDPGGMTLESTFLALERATEELAVVWAKVSHLQSVADCPALREAFNAALPRVSRCYSRIPLNLALWKRLQSFAASAAGASVRGVHRRLLEETLQDFLDAGASLPGEKRERLEVLQIELAQLTQKFAENVLDATNDWQLVVAPEEEGRLDGLPSQAKAAARHRAREKGLSGWRFTLHQPSTEPFLTYVHDSSLRREMWLASTAVGAREPWNNASLIRRILMLREEKARLLGREHFADCVLSRRMAGSGARALKFVEDFERRCVSGFRRECEELEVFKSQETGQPLAPLAPWDLLYWTERLRRARYDFDEEELRPYLPMDQVMAGLFETVRRVFAVEVTQREHRELEVWHPEVRYYDVHDRHGRHIGSFYADWHPRAEKRGGAWMNALITGGPQPDGRRLPHLGLICGNLTSPEGNGPALLTHREVETIFHEFGHLLHHLFGEVEVKSLNGTNVAWDFVELPSQILENWTWERAGLDLLAAHHKTGERLPEWLFQKMVAARNFRAASVMLRQVVFAKMDLLLHMKTGEFAAAPDVEPHIRAAVADCLPPTDPPAPTIVKRFTHIFSEPVGYAAGYYSYKWSEVLDADAFTRFQVEGVFNPIVGIDFVDKILSKGNWFFAVFSETRVGEGKRFGRDAGSGSGRDGGDDT